MVIEGDPPLVRLPREVSDNLDAAIRKFVDERESDGVKGHFRWHDADWWMVYTESVQIADETEPAIVQRRVTVGAFAGSSTVWPDIVFIPDVLLITAHGRYIQPKEERAVVGRSDLRLTINPSVALQDLQSQSRNILGKAWDEASGLDPGQAKVLIFGAELSSQE